MKEKFKKELHAMAKAGIISKLDRNTPTPCLDPTDLNKYIVHPVCNSGMLDVMLVIN